MKQTERNTNIKILGDQGEKEVINHFSKQGIRVEQNTDNYGYYDSKFYFDPNNPSTAQIKTLTPFRIFDCWAIKATGKQVEHLFKCDKLYLLSMHTNIPHEYDAWVLEIDLHVLRNDPNHLRALKGDNHKNPNNEVSLVIPRTPKYATKLFKLSEESRALLVKYSVSKVKERATKTKKIPA